MDIWWIDADGPRPAPVDTVDALRERDDGVLWIDLDHADDAGLALLTRLVDARPADVQDCHSRSPVPKLRPYADHMYSAINGLARADNGRLYFQPLKTFLAPRMLVTVLGPTSASLSHAASHRDLSALRLQIESGALRPTTGFELVAALRAEMLRAHEELVGVVAARIADLEQSVMQRDAVSAELLLGDLFGLRHDLQTIRTNAAQTHELYAHVIEQLSAQEGLMRIDLRRFTELRQAFGHLLNTADLEREYLQEVLDLFQTRVSTELNRFVRKITAFGTIGIGWTVIAGIYGMNFVHMPELSWQYGYPYALTLMVLVGVVFAGYFRHKRWL